MHCVGVSGYLRDLRSGCQVSTCVGLGLQRLACFRCFGGGWREDATAEAEGWRAWKYLQVPGTMAGVTDLRS